MGVGRILPCSMAATLQATSNQWAFKGFWLMATTLQVVSNEWIFIFQHCQFLGALKLQKPRNNYSKLITQCDLQYFYGEYVEEYIGR
jgi:hypothetical protein